MKYHLIFNKGGHYMGYTQDKKILKRFLELRGEDKFDVHTLNEQQMSDKLKKDIIDERSNMYYYADGAGSKIPMFGYEDMSFEDILRDSMIIFRNKVYAMYKHIQYLRLDKKERDAILDCLGAIETILNEIIEDEHEPAFFEYLDTEKLMKKFMKYPTILNHFAKQYSKK